MWVETTQEERAAWHAARVRDSLSHGRLIGGAVWILLSLSVAAGWYFFLRTGFIFRRPTSGSFPVRWAIWAALTLPLGYLISYFAAKDELRKLLSGAVCVNCDRVTAGAPGDTCECGEKLVSKDSVRWVDEGEAT